MNERNIVFEQDSLPIIYVNESEIEGFKTSNTPVREGFCYEWEEEQVYHIFFSSLKHSFGNVSKVFMCKCEDEFVTQKLHRSYPFIVSVFEGDVKIYQLCDACYIERPFKFIPAKKDLYSRNKGLLELDLLEHKRVMIVGLGSFGSQIAIELSKAGVGSYSLFDFDRIELHNLARHSCFVNDLGRLKTDAIADAILGKNPYAQVDKFPIDINKNLENGVLDAEVEKADIVICATDNNKSRFNLSGALVRHKKVGVFGRAITRAEGGDVFRYHPGGPCYNCMVGIGAINSSEEEISNEESARRDGRIPAYMSASDANNVVQVGLSTDIEPICNLIVKIALVELSRGTNSGLASLESELVYDYYMWANRRENKYSNWASLVDGGNKPTILRWYGAKINKVDGCPICSNNIMIDEGDDVLSDCGLKLNDDYSDISIKEDCL